MSVGREIPEEHDPNKSYGTVSSRPTASSSDSAHDEESPLLTRITSTSSALTVPTQGYGTELVALIIRTIPISCSFACQNIVQAISVQFAGHLGTAEIAAVAYGYGLAGATGQMMAIGGATALDTLCSQAQTRLRDKPHIQGVCLQKGLLVLSLVFLLVVAPLWIFSNHVFAALGLKEEHAQMTSTFLRIYLPGGLFQVQAECIKKVLQVQGLSSAVTWNVFASSCVAILTNYLLIFHSPLGYMGAPVAHTIYQFLALVFLSAFWMRNPIARSCWGGWSMEALKGWWEFIKLAVTGILTVATEWWSFQAIAIMCARLDTISVATQSILMVSDVVFATIPLGLSVSSSIRIGNLLGLGDYRGLKRFVRVPYLFTLCVGACIFTALFSSRHVFGRMFSDDPAVISYVDRVLTLMAGFQFSDIASSGGSGMLRGAQKNHLAGLSNLLGYYAVGLPLAWWFCFRKGMGLKGLWSGQILGSVTLALVQVVFLTTMDWKKETEMSRKRMEEAAREIEEYEGEEDQDEGA